MVNIKKEGIIVWTSSLVTLLLLIRYVPLNKTREAQVPFLFQQVITWLFGLVVVEKGLIKYPYRQYFKKSNKSSFTFEFFVYPAITTLFNLYYPKKSALRKVVYISSYSAVVTFFELIFEKYTDLIIYKKWKWYWTFITLFISYCISRVYYKWFFKIILK